MCKKRLRPGFTLVELLVVIGIIGVLVSVLLPVLSKARQSAQGVQCLANLHNLANIMQVYQANSRGCLSFTADAQSMYFSDSAKVGGTVARLKQCPTLVDYVSDPGNGLTAASLGYGWNHLLLNYTGLRTTRLIMQASAIRNPAEVLLLGDYITSDSKGLCLLGGSGAGASLASDGVVFDAFQFVNQSPKSMDLARPNFHGRHNGRGSVLWADGHGSMFAPIPVPLYATVGTGFTSLKMDPSFYRSKKIGYVAKSADDLQSMSALYYFVSKKAVLAPNDVNLTVKQFFE